jgi:DNA-binding LacI/PurR family transcriptional regulator
MEDGHRAFIKDIKEHPAIDGVLVTNDAVCRGVLYGILEKGLKIPEDIAVISHSNKGVNIFCHVPLTKLEVCPRDFAEKSVDSLIAKIKGEEYEEKKVLPRLVPGLSCGENE